jgi:hypothetical protein
VKVVALLVLSIVGALALTAVYFSVAAIPGAIAEFEREPEDLGGVIFWACVGLFLFGYCLTGIVKAMRRAYRIGTSGYACSVVAALLSIAMIGVGAFDGRAQRSENIALGILVALCVGAYVYLGHFQLRQSSNETESPA